MKRLFLYILLPLFLIVGCAKAPITGRTQIMMVSPQQEQALGFQAEREILKKEKISTDKALNERIRRIGMRIAKATGLNLDWKFYVIDKPDVPNAFCLANGHVFVYSGIMKYVDNDAQLATVIAHEIGHAIAHHVAEQVSVAMMTNLAATAAAVATFRESTTRPAMGIPILTSAFSFQKSVNPYCSAPTTSAAPFDESKQL